MKTESPYSIIRSKRVTEKAQTLAGLESAESNPSVARCKSPKVVFLVDPRANKQQIAWAIEEIYRDQKVKVAKVNTIRVPKKKRRVRGRLGFTSGLKKAYVTLAEGDRLES